MSLGCRHILESVHPKPPGRARSQVPKTTSVSGHVCQCARAATASATVNRRS